MGSEMCIRDSEETQYVSRPNTPDSAMATASSSRAPSPSTSVYAATEELRTEILAEVAKAKDEAYEETTDADAYNILHNSTPEAITTNFLALVTEYTVTTHLYGNLTDSVK